MRWNERQDGVDKMGQDKNEMKMRQKQDEKWAEKWTSSLLQYYAMVLCYLILGSVSERWHKKVQGALFLYSGMCHSLH